MRYDALGAVSSSAACRHGVVTRSEAALLGVHRNQVRRLLDAGLLTEPRAGVLVVSSVPPTWEQRLAVAQAAGGDHAVASHRSAARVHGLDGFQVASVLELVATRRLKVGTGVVIHQVAELERCDVLTLDGLRTTGMARTLADLGAVVAPDLVERALDDARRRRVSLRWIEQTARRLHRPGRAGPATLLRSIEAIQSGDVVRGSWFERVVELMLADPRIPPLTRQHVVTDAAGNHVATIDLAAPSIRLAIEAHSREFHFGRAAEAADEDRDHRLSVVGWDTTYLGYQSTRRPTETLELVARIVEERRRLVDSDSRGLAVSAVDSCAEGETYVGG
jgi:hypothetical protein